MSDTKALKRFADEELQRVELWFPKVLDDVIKVLGESSPSQSASDRTQSVDLLMHLRPLRVRMTQAFFQSLQSQVHRILAGGSPLPSPMAAPLSAGRGGLGGLSLVDDQAASSEVHIAFCTGQIKSIAEFEIRELTTFTSALAGDMQVAADHNPFKADACARALWAAAQLLPEARDLRAAFIKRAAGPFAEELRRVFAAASGRLEDSGIQPAVYRTVIVPQGSRSARPGDLLSDEAFHSVGGSPPAASTAAAAPNARSVADLDYLSLLGRIFDIILSDRRLTGDVKFAISRLQPSAMRLAGIDGTLLDAHEHALWLLVDTIAWQAEILPEAPHPSRASGMQFVQTLISHIGASARQDASLYQWALDSLRQAEHQRLEQTRTRLARVIEDMGLTDFRSTLPDRLGDTTVSVLDTTQMHTVPSQLLDLPAQQGSGSVAPSRWLASLVVGAFARLYLEGRWVHARLAWVDPAREGFLWADCRTEQAWPIVSRALQVLHGEGLAMTMEPRSLVRAAARLLATQLQR
jgi:hypothetical protein